MKPDEKNLERLVKRVLKGLKPPSADLLFHWTGLGKQGNQRLIQILNKHDGWSVFVAWAETDPILMTQLESIADAPGLTEKAAESLRSIGIEVNSGTLRTEALRIVETVKSGEEEKWPELHSRLLQNEDLFSGAIGLLELNGSSNGATFITTLLEENLTPEQEQLIRKSLYRLKQRGILPEESESISAMSGGEMFLIAENRIPLWQPLFYFRSHSSFTDEGDLFLIQISESNMEIVEQRRSVRITRTSMKQMGDRYSQHLQEQSGLSLPFHFISAPVARFFFSRSAALLKNPAAKLRMEEFVKFLAPGESQDPLSSFPA